MPLPRKTSRSGEMHHRFNIYGSAWRPYYLAHNTVLQRDVSNMPLATNSADITANMVALKNMTPGMSFNDDTYSVPLYIIDSRKIAPATVNFRNGDGSDKWIPQTMRQYLQNNVPLPDDILVPTGNDKSLTLYDIATNTYRGYWQLKRVSAQSWTAEWGGYLTNVYDMGGNPAHYDMQYTEGKLSAVGLVSNLMDITIEDIDRGEINHALNILLPWANADFSWPGKGHDGNVADPSYPMQGQWCRLNPTFDVDAQGYNRILATICKALQKYGGTVVDKVGTSYPGIYFSPASTLVERYTTGTVARTWTDVINQYAPGMRYTFLKQFPADQLQFAPKDWGKP